LLAVSLGARAIYSSPDYLLQNVLQSLIILIAPLNSILL